MNAAAKFFDEILRNREPKACSRRCGGQAIIDLFKSVKHAPNIFGGNPDTRIAHENANFRHTIQRGCGARLEHHIDPAHICEFDGVSDEII